MIKVYCNFTDGLFHIKIGKDCLYFTQVVELLRSRYYLKYNEKSYSWTSASAITIKAVVCDLESYDVVHISEEDKDLLNDLLYPIDEDFKKTKIIPDKELMTLHPPLVGKFPYENFQPEAIKKGLIQNRIILDIDMGHGKTYIVCMIIGTLLKQNKIDKILIIARPEGVENFRLELLRFLGTIITENDIGIVSTDDRKIENYFDKKIIITNYITYRLSGDYYNKAKTKSTAKKPTNKTIDFSKWGSSRLLLIDEAQSINSYDSLQSHFVHLYKDDFYRRISMSGSLGYNFLHYYSQIKFHLPKSIPYSYSVWTDYVAEKGTYFSKTAISKIKPDKVKEFKERLIDSLQVTYRNCIELPEHMDDIIYVRMTDKMKKLYKEFVANELHRIAIEREKEVDGNILENSFGTFTLMTSDPSLLDIPNWKFEDNPKTQVLESLVEKYMEEGRKIVIWGSHPKVLNTIAEYFKKYKPYVVHGDLKTSIKKSKRHDTVEDFKKSVDRNILISSYVLSTSINITEATRQIYFDLPLDSDNFSQSKKRIYRQGQKEPVITHYLLLNNTVDIYIWFCILHAKDLKKKTLSSKQTLELDDYKEVFNAKAESYLDYKG